MLVAMTYAVPEAHFETLDATHKAISNWQHSQHVNWFFNEQAVRTFFNNRNDKISVLVYKTYRRQDKRCVEIVIKADDAVGAFEQGYFGNIKLKQNKLVFDVPNDIDQLPPQQKNYLRKLCKDATISIQVITPNNIKSTNGFKKKNNNAVWFLSANGRGLDFFGKLDDFHVAW